MAGNVTADLSTVSPLNLVIIFCGIIILLVILLVFISRLKSFKFGPLEIKKEQVGQTNVYSMNRENQEIDLQLKMKVQSMTIGLNTRIMNIFSEFGICAIMHLSLADAIQTPLYESASNNHFTSSLSPENRDQYITNLLRKMEDGYVSIYNASKGIPCTITGIIPKWEEVQERMQKFLMEWINLLITEVIKTCIKKIEIYKKYEPAFKEDEYRSGIVLQCIAKNENYVKLLDRHGKGWQ